MLHVLIHCWLGKYNVHLWWSAIYSQLHHVSHSNQPHFTYQEWPLPYGIFCGMNLNCEYLHSVANFLVALLVFLTLNFRTATKSHSGVVLTLVSCLSFPWLFFSYLLLLFPTCRPKMSPPSFTSSMAADQQFHTASGGTQEHCPAKGATGLASSNSTFSSTFKGNGPQNRGSAMHEWDPTLMNLSPRLHSTGSQAPWPLLCLFYFFSLANASTTACILPASYKA